MRATAATAILLAFANARSTSNAPLEARPSSPSCPASLLAQRERWILTASSGQKTEGANPGRHAHRVPANFATIATTILLTLLASPSFATDLKASLIDRPSVGDLYIYGAPGKTIVTTPDIPGRSAIHVDINTPAVKSHPWDIGAGATTTADIHAGEHVVAAVWMRATTGTGDVTLRLQSSDAPYDGIAQTDIAPGPAWQLYRVEGTATQDYPAGHTGLTLSLNTIQQSLDIGPIYILKTDAPGDLTQQLSAIPLSRTRDAGIAMPDGTTNAATLTVPPGRGPFPAVLMVAGSGRWGRNPNDPVARALLDSGLAVVQFDKRGVGQSTGTYADFQTAQLSRDAGVIAAWLRQQPDIDPRRTGILGHSEGGMIAISAAAADPAIAFVVDLAGPAQDNGERTILVQIQALRDAGAPEDTVTMAEKMWRAGLDATRQATSDDDAAARTQSALAPFLGPKFTQADLDAIIQRVRDPALRAVMLYDPKAELQRIRAPVLGLYGTMDHQVPGAENAAALKDGLSNDADVTVILMPGMNHQFQHAKLGTEAEWTTLAEPARSDPEFLKTITDWVRAHTKKP